MAGLVGYGGDPRVVASRDEILRIETHVGQVASELVGGAWKLLPNPLHRAQVDAAIPGLEFRMQKTRMALLHAAESYFSADARVSHTVESIGHALKALPWLKSMLPKGEAIAAYSVSLLAPGDIGAESTRALAAATTPPKNLVHDRPVQFKRVASTDHSGVYNLGDIGSRLQELNKQTREIRIETYVDSAGEKTMLVLLPGTQNLSPIPGENPFDPTTDAMLVANPEKSELQKAIIQALEDSGAKGHHVVIAGYSLGGIVAANIAAKGEFDVTGLITIGSPVAGANLTSDVPTLSIQHTNDPVPAATGKSNPLTENWATVSRHLDVGPGHTLVKAHELEGYRGTLSLTDSSEIPGVKRVRDLILNQVVGKKLVETQTFEFTR